MPIDLEKSGFDREALRRLLEAGDSPIKLRLGNGKIIDLLKEHLDDGIATAADPLDKVDDHDKVGVKVDDHERVRSLHTKEGRIAPDFRNDDLVRFENGVFIGDIDAGDLEKLSLASHDVLKGKDLVLIKKLLNR